MNMNRLIEIGKQIQQEDQANEELRSNQLMYDK